MGKTITIKKGYDIKVKGWAEKKITNLPFSDVIAIKPQDFPALTPKLSVEAGQEVLAGQPLFYDKNNPKIRFPSPVSGEVVEIIRGDKRRILEVRVIPDRTTKYASFPQINLPDSAREAIVEQLLESGCWAYIRQRPYSLIAHPEDIPKAIFISCFDSAPLAPDLGYLIEQERTAFQTGLQVLAKLANGHLHISLRKSPDEKLSDSDFKDVSFNSINHFRGPHPAGNIGVQIHHIAPIQKGELVWYVHPQDVLIIGRLFTEGRYRAERTIALTGSCVTQPQYFNVITGQKLSTIVHDRLTNGNHRLIQGNILTGKKTSSNDFLSFYGNQLTVIPEGNKPEFLGWLLPGLEKLSLSRTYFSWLTPKRTYDLTTNQHGEERAFVMTGQYDKVLPMNIYPVHLLKAILAGDIERMEQLGIYEVAEEDFALCEFVCTSKIDVQRIIAEGLDLIRREG
ncbi:MAG: Na(+)-translocating NADH-quinone reductase subunit A [Spirosomataceae bacterium]